MLDTIIKRDGREVPFNPDKITEAILRAFHTSDDADPRKVAEEITEHVVHELKNDASGALPSVEGVQDTVERMLIKHGYVHTAKSYNTFVYIVIS